ncbi:MAG: glucosyl-3-phosphoglycerate synthase [Thermoleophilaceae bacterium]
MIRSAHHADFGLDGLLERKDRSVTAVLPARECAETVGPAVERILGLKGLVDQVLVVDSDSADGTAYLAAVAGAEVAQENDLVPELGPALGKGDAMWRALSVARGDLVVYLDADTPGFSPAFVTGLVGPLLTDPSALFTKATYQRAFRIGGFELAGGGGRVSQLTARPLLDAFYPDLAGLIQPLSGEVAGARGLFERMPFSTGYGVEAAMLLDLRELIGASAMVQVDLGERLNAHQSLEALRPMADAVLAVVVERLRRDGRLVDASAGAGIVERPPFVSLRGAAA